LSSGSRPEFFYGLELKRRLLFSLRHPTRQRETLDLFVAFTKNKHPSAGSTR
jgi:hypothetical protein